MSKVLLSQEIIDQQKRGVLLVLTGPTGAGKDAVFERLLSAYPDTITKLTTTSSRALRVNESEGNPYYFTSRDEFERMIGEGEFFEWVEFRGHLYGTQKKTLEQAMASGKDVIWHIEAKGVKNIKQKIKETVKRSVFVYLTAPDVETLKNRVINDEGKQVVHRWNEPLVLWEMEQYDDCDYLVVNPDGALDESVRKVKAIMDAKREEILR